MRALLPLIALLAFTTAAMAQPAPDGPPPPDQSGAPPAYDGAPPQAGRRAPLWQRFDAANTTHDGKLTLDQAQAAHMVGVAGHFSEIDADRKGYVTLQDLHAWIAAQRAARAGGQMQPPPPPQ